MKKFLSAGLIAVALALVFEVERRTVASSVSTDAESTAHKTYSTESRGDAVGEAELREASSRAIKLLQRSQAVWYQKQTCTSCHHQLLPEIALKLASERGISFDTKAAEQATSAAFAFLKDLDSAVQGYDYIDVLFDGWALTSAHVAGIPPSLTTAAEAQFIASRQLEDGGWPTIDVRPPQSESRFTTTAVCAQAIRLYLPDHLKSEKARRLTLARRWLQRARPRTTEDRTFQILGLKWSGAGELVRERIARQLLAEQREDGGWAQLPGLSSDAYATGETLYALHQGAGIGTTSTAYQRGLRFLLKSQQPDGAWVVKSRLHPPAPVSPPYVNVEFPPFNHDQFISAMATSWSAAALLLAVPPRGAENAKHSTSPYVADAEQPEWVRAALTGSASDLRKLLDGGMDPNSKTAEGTTALMLAARDIEKVKLLIDRGADVNARAASGISPLMVAARCRGNAGVVRLLLSKGAKPNSDKSVEVRNDASALFFAVMAGDLKTIDALVGAGARLNSPMKILGTFVATPLNYATFLDDPRLIEYLISKGADPNEVDGDGISVLAWATIGNRIAVLQSLLTRGAKVNPVDKHGMTPLLYAASIDFGDTAAMQKLISGGADLAAKNKDGLTAVHLAQRYQHRALAEFLAAKTASR